MYRHTKSKKSAPLLTVIFIITTISLLLSKNTIAVGLSNNQSSVERHVHVNGEHLEIADIQSLDQIADGRVDDGYYWINTQTGEWGHEGNKKVLGIIQSIKTRSTQIKNAQRQQNKQTTSKYRDWEGVSSTGTVVSGRNSEGKKCTYVSAGGMTFKSCD